MTHSITGELFIKMINNASAAIETHKNEINELNVFPVPDGDTGTNMGLTISAAETALASTTPGTLGHVAEVASGALLRGARGNSGVILSLLFRGLSRRLKDVDEANAAVFAEAMAAGVESAYKAVMKPAEGTILTVSRLAVAEAVEKAKTEKDIELVLESALKVGYVALDDTINQNPVLEKAGVIDAGGKGYLYMLDGMLRALRGEVMVKAVSAGAADTGKADFAQYSEEDINFAYCTEFIVERKNKKNPNQLRDFLDKRGDSIVVVDDDEIIKVHVHTNDPGEVLTEALKYGAFATIKIDCMRVQHSEFVKATDTPQPSAASSAAPAPVKPEELKDFAFVAVCVGAGIEAVFGDLGVDGIIHGGQTMNPSTEDILEKVVAVPSNTVFILPNNKNIIMAAEQCARLTDKQVYVIPTRSAPQGIAAMLSIDGAGDAAEMQELMTAAAKRIRTAQITKAARNSTFDGKKIKRGAHLALIDDVLAASGSNFGSVAALLAEKLCEDNPEFITVYVGEDARDKDVETVIAKLKEAAPSSEVMHIVGGQPVYSFIISAE